MNVHCCDAFSFEFLQFSFNFSIFSFTHLFIEQWDFLNHLRFYITDRGACRSLSLRETEISMTLSWIETYLDTTNWSSLKYQSKAFPVWNANNVLCLYKKLHLFRLSKDSEVFFRYKRIITRRISYCCIRTLNSFTINKKHIVVNIPQLRQLTLLATLSKIQSHYSLWFKLYLLVPSRYYLWENDLIVLNKELFHCLLLFYLSDSVFINSFLLLWFFYCLHFLSIFIFLFLLLFFLYFVCAWFCLFWLHICMSFSEFLSSSTYIVIMLKLSILFAKFLYWVFTRMWNNRKISVTGPATKTAIFPFQYFL